MKTFTALFCIILVSFSQSCTIGKPNEDSELDVYNPQNEDFFQQDEAQHYVIYALQDCGLEKMKKAKNIVKSNHHKFIAFKRLRISHLYLNVEEKTQLILIRGFENKISALDYIDRFSSLDDIELELYAVTQNNYKEIVMQKSTENYISFYDYYYKS